MFILSIDIGTTAVKVVVVECVASSRTSSTDNKKNDSEVFECELRTSNDSPSIKCEWKIVCSSNRTHNARISLPNPLHFEQEIHKIHSTINECILIIPIEVRQRISHVSLTGQMHGVVRWSSSSITNENSTPIHSTLITWEDRRCDKIFLREINEKIVKSRPYLSNENRQIALSGGCLSSGFGFASLLWIERNLSSSSSSASSSSSTLPFESTDCIGTVMDYFYALFTRSDRSFMDPSNAASFGLFDITLNEWIHEFIPTYWRSRLPIIKASGTLERNLHSTWINAWNLSSNVTVSVACGDAAAALYALPLKSDEDALFVLGTAGVLSIPTSTPPSAFAESSSSSAFISSSSNASSSSSSSPSSSSNSFVSSVEYRPSLVAGCGVLVCASLNGGNAFENLAILVQRWLEELSEQRIALEKVYSKMIELGELRRETRMKMNVRFLKERFQETVKNEEGKEEGKQSDDGAMIELSASTSLGDLSASCCRAIIENLFDLLTRKPKCTLLDSTVLSLHMDKLSRVSDQHPPLVAEQKKRRSLNSFD